MASGHSRSAQKALQFFSENSILLKRVIVDGTEKRSLEISTAFLNGVLANLPRVVADAQREMNHREVGLFLDILAYGLQSFDVQVALTTVRILSGLIRAMPRFLLETMHVMSDDGSPRSSTVRADSYRTAFLGVS